MLSRNATKDVFRKSSLKPLRFMPVTLAVGLACTANVLPFVAQRGFAIDLPQGTNLVPRSQWTTQPPNGKLTQELYGRIQGVWGCVKFDILRDGYDIICGYLSIYPVSPPPGVTPSPGTRWTCIPGTNALIYSYPFNKGVCFFASTTNPPRGAFYPTLAQTGQAAQDRVIFTNIAQGLPVSKCVQPDGNNGSVTVYRVNPNAVELRLKLFIPSPAAQVKIPVLNIPTPLFYGGDNRSFSYNGNTFRSIQSVVIDPTKAQPGSLGFKDFGESVEYSPSDVQSVAGKPDWWYGVKPGAQPILRGKLAPTNDNNRITVTRLDQNTTKVTFLVRGSLPLNLAAPPFDANVNVFIRKLPGQAPQYRIQGGHDGFPAYELYVNGARAYQHDPVATGKTPNDLFGGPDEININTPYRNVTCPRGT